MVIVMKNEWEFDGRTIPDDAMYWVRAIAVRAVVKNGVSPESVITTLGMSRSCIYDWLNRYDDAGLEGLRAKDKTGSEPLITMEMDKWLRIVVLNSTPVDHGYDTVLWTRDILAEVLCNKYGIDVAGRTVSEHLKEVGLSYQKPVYRAKEQDPDEVEYFLSEKFPRIKKLAGKMDADIAFEDESGVGMSTHSGRTWGDVGHTPKVLATNKRGGYNILSTVTAQGVMNYSISDGSVDSFRYVKFLKQLIKGRKKPLIIIADRASFHKSKEVRNFVRANRTKIRIYFLPKYSPELNPDEHVWRNIKDEKIGKQPIKDKPDLKKRLRSALVSLQRTKDMVISFFHFPETKYALT